MVLQETKYRKELGLSTSAESFESADGNSTIGALKPGFPLQGESIQQFKRYRNRFSEMLIK